MKESVSYRIFRTINGLMMLSIIVVMLYPMLYILFASFSNPTRITANTGILWHPLGFEFGAYEQVFKHPMLLKSYTNTIIIVCSSLLVNMVLTIMGGYALSRKGPMFLKPITLFFIFTMFFSGGLIPFFLTVRNLKLYDTRWAIILSTAVNTYNLIIMRTGFAGVPASLEESAKIDGANDFWILLRIMVPLIMPTIAVISLYYAVAHWNAWFNSMLFLQNRELFPLQLILREILIASDTSSMTADIAAGDKFALGETIKYAVIIVSTVPILCLYPFLQRFFVKGVMVGAVKG